MSSLLPPPWMWLTVFWSRSRYARRFRTLARRPILRVPAGSSTAAAFCSGKNTVGLRHIQPPHDSGLAAVAQEQDVAQRILLCASLEAGANSPFLRWMRIF